MMNGTMYNASMCPKEHLAVLHRVLKFRRIAAIQGHCRARMVLQYFRALRGELSPPSIKFIHPASFLALFASVFYCASNTVS